MVRQRPAGFDTVSAFPLGAVQGGVGGSIESVEIVAGLSRRCGADADGGCDRLTIHLARGHGEGVTDPLGDIQCAV